MREKLNAALTAAINFLDNNLGFTESCNFESIPFVIERTKDLSRGDYASNVALLLAKKFAKKPYDLAVLIVDAMPKIDGVLKIEIAGPGFINFFLEKKYFFDLINAILQEGDSYGRSSLGQGKSVIIEFVSSNPTGPLHVGHGRGAAFGAACADLLEAIGFTVHREYYVNDYGRQMDILTVSVWLRYLELNGFSLHLPSNFYRGDYVIDIARRLHVEFGMKLMRSIDALYDNLPADVDSGGDGDFYIDALIARSKNLLGKNDYRDIFNCALSTIISDMKEDLEEFGVVYQEWFYESSLYRNGDVVRSIAKLRDLGSIYEKDGATWFRATSYGDDKDRVVIRENGSYTYFASDIAYHFKKYERGFDLIIDVLGADHHGYAPRIMAFLRAASCDIKKLSIPIVQFANLYRGKTKVSMSTREGSFVTLRTLREEVGNDAARFFYIMRKNDQHLDFDLELAKSQSKDNPVYYIQYAHARICSVLNQAHEKNIEWENDFNLESLNLLCSEHEKKIFANLSSYKEVLEEAALKYEPHLLAHYLLDLANSFHSYYNAEQFLVDDEKLRAARLMLIASVRQIIKNGLCLLMVSAPCVM